MKSEDVSALIAVADEALAVLRRYRATGDLGNTVRLMSRLAVPLFEGDDLSSDFKALIPLVEHSDVLTALGYLRSPGYFNQMQRSITFEGYLIQVREVLVRILATLNAKSRSAARTVFFSWQATSPEPDNRNFIQECLKKAVSRLNLDLEEPDREQASYSLDRDTLGTPGSPSIPHTILEKIEQAGFYVADVTIVEGKQSNSNVMLELGYALMCLGESRVLMVCNEAYGSVESLPFNVRTRRVLCYNYRKTSAKGEVDPKKPAAREDLITRLVLAITDFQQLINRPNG